MIICVASTGGAAPMNDAGQPHAEAAQDAAGVHAFAHDPQFLSSFVVLTHSPEHSSSVPWHAGASIMASGGGGGGAASMSTALSFPQADSAARTAKHIRMAISSVALLQQPRDQPRASDSPTPPTPCVHTMWSFVYWIWVPCADASRQWPSWRTNTWVYRLDPSHWRSPARPNKAVRPMMIAVSP